MTSKTEVAVPEPAPLPALINPSALGNLNSGDMTLPRLDKGEYQSGLVQADVVPKGSIFARVGKDDPEPTILGPTVGDKVLVHVLSARKGKSANINDAGEVVKNGGTFTTWAFEDPSAPVGANVDFHYVLLVPEFDLNVPVTLTLSKTSVPAGKSINFLLLRNPELPPYRLAFELNTKPREKAGDGTTFRWFVWQATLVEADPANVEAAAKLSVLVNAAPDPVAAPAPSTAPAI